MKRIVSGVVALLGALLFVANPDGGAQAHVDRPCDV